jgi:hypothetical protein
MDLPLTQQMGLRITAAFGSCVADAERVRGLEQAKIEDDVGAKVARRLYPIFRAESASLQHNGGSGGACDVEWGTAVTWISRGVRSLRYLSCLD